MLAPAFAPAVPLLCTPLAPPVASKRPALTSRLSAAKPYATRPSIALDPATFLKDRWGVRPTFLPALLPSYEPPLTADDLAGLACEEDVESRIITGRGAATGAAGEEAYTLSLGPFEESVFQSPLCADERPWTLLVHEVNRHIPEVADLLDRFRILPNWRVDDVMISYANTGGGVGPHTDNYDVFLLQVAGRRRWRTSSRPMSAAEEREALAPGLDIRVLRGGFEADHDFELGPGDCMYVPPRCPHWGEALDSDCITFSIGFRAPAVADLASGWVDEAVRRAGLQDVFLKDIKSDLLANAEEPGLISQAAGDAAYDAVLEAIRDRPGRRAEFRAWFAEQVSAPKRFREALGEDGVMSAGEAVDLVKGVLNGVDVENEGVEVRQQEGSVFSFAYLDGHAGQVALFVDGDTVFAPCNARLASLVCSCRATPASAYTSLCQRIVDGVPESDIVPVLSTLFSRGLLYI